MPRKLKLSPEEHTRRDFRIKCSFCKRWMRRRITEKTPTERRPQPLQFACQSCEMLPFPEDPTPTPE